MNAAPLFSDMQAIAGLRSEARAAPGQSLEKVAGQFESLFVQMMLKSMRDATVDGGLFNSSQMEFAQQMFDQQVSLEMSQNGGLGLVQILVQQLGGKSATQTSESSATQPLVALDEVTLDEVAQEDASASLSQPLVTMERMALIPRHPSAGAMVSASPDSARKQSLPGPITQPREAWQPQTPEEFIRGVWEHAVNAADQIGVSPEVLVAQSALETGWGKKVIRKAGGDSSFNLFGIKHGANWSGETAAVKTVEFRNGVARLEQAAFRAYESVGSAFEDYINVLKSSPRYQQALGRADNAEGFLQELQDAGYATDPAYADKILGIMKGSRYQAVISELKDGLLKTG